MLGIVRDWVFGIQGSWVHPSKREDTWLHCSIGLSIMCTIMMVLTFLLIAIASIALLKKAQWGWILVMVALLVALGIFVNDVDFSTNLGLQFS